MRATIKKRAQFNLISKRGKSIATKGIVVQCVLRDAELDKTAAGWDGLRIGYTVSKNVSKKAVLRNRLKRKLRAVADEVMTDLARDEFDYVLIGRRNGLDRHFLDLIKDLKYAMHNINK